MATTSGNLTAGQAASGGQGGKGKGRKGRVTGLVASTTISLGLLVGVALGQRPASPAAPPVRAHASVGARPADASTSAAWRWDFGPGQVGQRPAGASMATEYRWDFGGER